MIIGRFLAISRAVWGYAIWWALVQLGWITPKESPPDRLARTLQQLGTTFIKLGQGLSLYPELLPEPYIRALETLQENVAPFPGDVAIEEVERAFGRPLEDLFVNFERTPMAAASVAQVHAATLHPDQPVVVKVRRPGIKQQVAQDMGILKGVLRAILPFFPTLQHQDALGIMEEIDLNLHKEMDFRREARNAKRLHEMFQNSPAIRIPTAPNRLYTETVMVQERVCGKRIDDPTLREQGAILAQNLVDAYLVQLFVHGLFHADPHPGNLVVTDDNQLAFLDFGLVSTLAPDTRRQLAAYMLAFILRDSDWLMETYLEMGIVSGDIDCDSFRRGLQALVDEYATLPLKEWSFAEAFLDVLRLGRGQNIALPRNLVILDRALFLVEGAVRALDPDFNLIDGILSRRAFIADWATRGPSQEAVEARGRFEWQAFNQDLPRLLIDCLHRLRLGQLDPTLHLMHEGDTRRQIRRDRQQNRLSLTVLAGSLWLTATWLLAQNTKPELWGMPVLPLLLYLLAWRWTLRLLAAITRSGEL